MKDEVWIGMPSHGAFYPRFNRIRHAPARNDPHGGLFLVASTPVFVPKHYHR